MVDRGPGGGDKSALLPYAVRPAASPPQLPASLRIMWLWLLLLPVSTLAAPVGHNLSVGQVFSLTLSPRTTVTAPLDKALPGWISYKNGVLTAIPTAKDVGSLSLQLKSPGKRENTVTLNVSEDDTNPCGTKETTWVEVIYSQDADVKKRAEAAETIAETLGVGVDTMRVLNFDYSRQFRTIDDIAKAGDGAFTVIKPYCDGEVEAMELATDDMDKLLDDDDDIESEFDVTITKGLVVSRRNRQGGDDVLSGMNFRTNEPEEVTKPSTKTTTQRTTRQSSDNPPVRLNSLAGFTCTAGTLCESVIPDMTFKDAEEGDTHKLQLTVVLLDGGNNFLYIKDRKLQGIPLAPGEYQYRLEARDSRGQMASAAFAVVVKPAPPHNHHVTFVMDLTQNQKIESNPELLSDFVRLLAQNTKTKPESITIRDIQKVSDKTHVSWSNNSLPYKTCSNQGIEQMMFPRMVIKNKMRMNRQFESAMTARFNLRHIDYTLLGNCIKDEETATTVLTVEAESQSSFPWAVLIVALIVFVLLAICLVVMCTKKKIKKGTKPSEYLGKGTLPVVFPEEITDEHELIQATTPMLTKEERPPLKVSQHENPLYRPPPPLVASSPRVGSAAGSLPPTQRMPPPYVPP